jgi:ABC-type multidrug transport system fused ATPase/permease subunit
LVLEWKINHCLITAAFYDIDSGEILIDGKIFMISIRESSWQYEYSSQDVILFGGTIKENITENQMLQKEIL